MLLARHADDYIESYDTRVWHPKRRPHYGQEFARRVKLLQVMRSSPEARASCRLHYKHNPIDFILDWVTTYDPRNSQKNIPTLMPMCMFYRQIDFVQFLHECVTDGQHGLVEKCRDMGASYVALGFALWLWLFWPGSAIGVGSRKEMLVDRIGDPDSLLEKVRRMILALPRDLFWPEGFNIKSHMPSMKIINPANGAIIAGEAGDNIGRGGRKTIYFCDEAQPLDAKILTPSGWSTMGQMVPGSKVIGADGKRRTVTHINPCGEHDVYRVTFADGTSTEASTNHKWAVTRIIGKNKEMVLTTKEIFETYRRDYDSGQYHFIYHNTITKPVRFNSRGKLPLHPYIVGVLLGDGSIKHVPKYRPSFTSVDPQIPEEVSKLLPEDVKITKDKSGICYRLGDAQGRRGRFKVSRASQAIMAAGIAGYGAENKHIPDKYKFSTIQNRLALLQGLMDTDGSASNSGYPSFHTCSRQLADDVRFIVQSLGGTATLTVRPDHRGFRDMYVVFLALPDGMTPFRLERKVNSLVKRKCRMNKNIVKVEHIGRKNVQCITVDAEDGLYLTDDCIVTHNSAHYERAESIQAALGDNTDVIIDISSVNGPGNVFHRRRLAGEVWEPGKKIKKGKTRVFIMDWRDHPAKSKKWYDTRRQKAEDEGLLHLFAQEVERDYNAAVEGVLIPGAWVQAAIDSHVKLGFEPTGIVRAGQDVADGGGDLNALCVAHGCVVQMTTTDGREVDVAVPEQQLTAVMMGAQQYQYESTGVGAGAKVSASAFENLQSIPWSPSGGVVNPHEDDIAGTKPGTPDRKSNKDYFKNANAQAAWALRMRFQRTYKAVIKGEAYDPDELISIPAHEHELIAELSQPTYAIKDGKIVINKKPDGAKSPNRFDAVKICFAPVQKKAQQPEYGVVSAPVGIATPTYGVI